MRQCWCHHVINTFHNPRTNPLLVLVFVEHCFSPTRATANVCCCCKLSFSDKLQQHSDPINFFVVVSSGKYVFFFVKYCFMMTYVTNKCPSYTKHYSEMVKNDVIFNHYCAWCVVSPMASGCNCFNRRQAMRQ